MKTKIQVILIILSVSFFISCENMEIEYPDFEYQTVYFPYQYPVRTLSLGNDLIDNSLDKEYKFNIGVSIGGLYGENKQDWEVEYAIDNTLIDNYLVNAYGDTLKKLPEAFYSLTPGEGTVTIPKGSFSGLIEVQLTDEFFNDPAALTGEYVIPLKIVSTSADSILAGLPAPGITDPNRHLSNDWDGGISFPKDYTLFGVKYVNPYHGKWLRRSRILVRDGVSNEVIDTIINRTQDIEKNQVVDLFTRTLHAVETGFVGDNTSNHFYLEVDNATKNITINPVEGSDLSITGTGQYIDQSEELESWGGKPRDALYLQYEYTLENGNIHQAWDTLVFRDRQIKMEDTRPTLTP